MSKVNATFAAYPPSLVEQRFRANGLYQVHAADRAVEHLIDGELRLWCSDESLVRLVVGTLDKDVQMSQFPKEPKKIRERINRYERELRKEYEKFGFISDDSGKRYLLGPLYLILGDLTGAIRSFEWFEQMFPDDIGEPFHYLCWTLALYRSGGMTGASLKLRQAMLSNLYLIPRLLGLAQEKLNIWHSSNLTEKDYLQYAPSEIWALWDKPALQWAKETYDSPEFCRVRARYIEIYEQLRSEPPGPKRSQLVSEAYRLQFR